MSTSETSCLHVHGCSPTTQIEVFDSLLARVPHEQNSGEFEKELRPGIYNIVFREAGAMSSVDILLRPGQPQIVRQEAPLAFATPVPIPGTATWREWHEQCARNIWRGDATKISAPANSGIFVFVRELEPRAEGDTPSNPAAGLRLLDKSGVALHSFDVDATGCANWEYNCAGSRLALAPGFYRLQFNPGSESGSVEIPIVTCRDWVTHVYLFARHNHQGRLTIDLASASMAMTRPDYVEREAVEAFRVREMALSALRDGQFLMSNLTDRALLEDFEDPLLGIIGAQLRISDKKLGRAGLERALTRLAHLMGGSESALMHPDVCVLHQLLDFTRTRRSLRVLKEPPVLGRSWRLACKLASREATSVDPHSLAGAVGPAILHGTSWLIWSSKLLGWQDFRGDELPSSLRPLTKSAVQLSNAIPRARIESASDAVRALDPDSIQRVRAKLPAASPMIQALRSGIDDQLARGAPELGMAASAPPSWKASNLAMQLGWPLGTLEEVAANTFDLATRELSSAETTVKFLYGALERLAAKGSATNHLSAFISRAVEHGDRGLTQQLFARLCAADSKFSFSVFPSPGLPGASETNSRPSFFLRVAPLKAEKSPALAPLDQQSYDYFGALPGKPAANEEYDDLSSEDAFRNIADRGIQ